MKTVCAANSNPAADQIIKDVCASERERKLLTALCGGSTLREAASVAGVGVITACNDVKLLCRQLGLPKRQQGHAIRDLVGWVHGKVWDQMSAIGRTPTRRKATGS